MTHDQPKDSVFPPAPAGRLARLRAYLQVRRAAVALAVVLFLIVDGIVFLVLMPPRAEKTPATASARIPVATAPVVVSDVPEVVLYPGLVEAETEVTLASEGMGRIVSLGADKGDDVAVGQLLMNLDNRSQAAAARGAEANLAQATNDLARLEELRETGAVSASDHDAAVTRRELAESALEEARASLAKCELRSPIRGVVLDRRVEVGEFATPGQAVFRLADMDQVKVVADLPERDVFAVKEGQEVPFEVESLEGRAFTGRVAYVASAAHPQSNTFRAEILAENEGRLLKPGVIATIRLTRRTIPQAVTVPLEALVPSKGQYIAYVAENGVAVRRIVTLAAIVDSRAVVGEGLRGGERVIVGGQRLVSDGVAVTATSRAEEAR